MINLLKRLFRPKWGEIKIHNGKVKIEAIKNRVRIDREVVK